MVTNPKHEPGERAMEETTGAKVVANLDGSRTEYDDISPEPGVLERFLREVFEQHWDGITVGPILQGAAYELQYSKPPKVSLGAGYLTVDTGEYHFHLYIGEQTGAATSSINPELARQRRVSRAAFFREVRDEKGCMPGSWGFRLWNGLGEQMITIFFPNPYFDKQGRIEEPKWERVQLWERMRAEYAGAK
jgi:hypothetical protein